MAASTDVKPPDNGENIGQTISHGTNLDEKASSLVDVEDTYTIEEERALLRKLDLTILPMMCAIFFLQYLDKQSLSYASVSTSSNNECLLGRGSHR